MQNRYICACVLLNFFCLGLLDRPAAAQTFEARFGHVIDIDNLDNYANQSVPAYIQRDNTAGNPITDAGATLGRILFYDKELSFNRTTSCASCHKQELAFADDAVQSVGENGVTGRHSMRLINARFSEDPRVFWDERATSIENQATQPIRDHVEMGFSGQNGNPDFSALVTRLSEIEYYQDLFTLAFGDPAITETRMQNALAQFVRSIQSFDSKFDVGRAQRNNNGQPFPNFTQQENQGKQLFLGPPQFQGPNRVGGGAGCQVCHRMPEFDIAPNSNNNGVIQNASGGGTDLTNERSPSLRDVFSPAGGLNTQMMHNGAFTTMDQVLTHYNSPPLNPNLDNRLRRGPNQRNLNLTPGERAALIAFLQTLTGSNVYVDPKWSDPFVNPPPIFVDAMVNSGVGGNSMVEDILVVFQGDVATSAASFTLTNTTTGEPVNSLQLTSTVNGDETWVTLTFAPGASVVTRPSGNSLADGAYELVITASEVTYQGSGTPMNQDVVMGGVTDGLYRLFGDGNGDALCDFIDFSDHFLPAFGTGVGTPGFRGDLDFNGDGNVDFIDFSDGFLPNFGTGL